MNQQGRKRPPPDGHGQASGQPGAGEGTAGRRGLRAPWKMMPQAFEDRAWCTWSGTRSSSTTNREQATFVLNLRKPRKQTFPNCQERRSTGCGGPAQWGRGRPGGSEKTPHANLMFTFELFLDPTSGGCWWLLVSGSSARTRGSWLPGRGSATPGPRPRSSPPSPAVPSPVLVGEEGARAQRGPARTGGRWGRARNRGPDGPARGLRPPWSRFQPEWTCSKRPL